MPHWSLFWISLALFTAGAVLCRTRGGGLRRPERMLAGTLAFGFVFFALMFLVSDYFSGEGINYAFWYHLSHTMAGAGYRAYRNLIVTMSLFAALGAIALFWMFRGRGGKAHQGHGLRSRTAAQALLLGALLLNPGVQDLVRLCGSGLCAVTDAEAGTAGALEPRTWNPEFAAHYRSPAISGRPVRPLNLVFIYAESLERTYFDSDRFPGLIRQLGALEARGTTFTDLRQVIATGFTIAGMVASQCGVPLFAPSDGNLMGNADRFLPGARCLGDLLRAQGYRSEYLGGAALSFAGKGKFLTGHGFDAVYGFDELMGRLDDADYRNAWGLYDDTLFDLAFERFQALAARERPFALFTLTLDTHHPEGFGSKACAGLRYGDGTNPILNAVACSDRLIGRFVRRILDSPAAERTLVVVASDHLAMKNTAWTRLNEGPRRNLLLLLDPAHAGPRRIDRPGSTLDTGVTVLHAMGFQAEIGLGRDLLGSHPTLVEQQPHPEALTDLLVRFAGTVVGFWQFPRIDRGLIVSPLEKLVRIGHGTYRMPLVIRYDAALRSTIYFARDRAEGDARLAERVRETGPDEGYLWLSRCAAMAPPDDPHIATEPGAGFCLRMGRPSHGPYVTLALHGDLLYLPPERLRRVAGFGPARSPSAAHRDAEPHLAGP